MTQYLERYQNGLHRPVWDELVRLGPEVRQEPHGAEAVSVVRELMTRVRRNLEQLVLELEKGGVEFGLYPDGEPLAGYRGPLLPPDPEIDHKVHELESLTGGPVPLSLYGFWKWVGTVNLIGVHPDLADIEHTLDPLWVYGIDDTLSEYAEWTQRREYDGERQPFAAVIAPDDLHKDNISGGAPYEIELPDPAIDALLLNEGSDSLFVDYLRDALDWSGYAGFAQNPAGFPDWLDEISEKLERF